MLNASIKTEDLTRHVRHRLTHRKRARVVNHQPSNMARCFSYFSVGLDARQLLDDSKDMIDEPAIQRGSSAFRSEWSMSRACNRPCLGCEAGLPRTCNIYDVPQTTAVELGLGLKHSHSVHRRKALSTNARFMTLGMRSISEGTLLRGNDPLLQTAPSTLNGLGA